MILRRFAFMLVLLLLASCQSNDQDNNAKVPFDLVFMTDSHVIDQQEVKEAMVIAIDSINKINPDLVIAGGDLVMDATKNTLQSAERQRYLYDSLTAKLKMPQYRTIGNHDIFGWHFGDSLINHPSYNKKFFSNTVGYTFTTFDHRGWRFMLLDGITKTANGHYIGRIDSLQMQWIKEVLAQTDSLMPIAIVTHIPFATIGYQMDIGALTPIPEYGIVANAKDILALFSHHRLKLVLQGHLHLYEKLLYNQVTFITGGSLCGQWWQGKNNFTEEGFVKLRLFPDGKVDADYVAYNWNPKDIH